MKQHKQRSRRSSAIQKSEQPSSQQAQVPPISPHSRCSCGQERCETMELVRLLTETTDNFLLLQTSATTVQHNLLPLLEQMEQDQQASLERWQMEQDMYRSQMLSSVRPTMRWQEFSPLERELAYRKRWATDWHLQQQQRLQDRLDTLRQAMQAHEEHLVGCAARFVQQQGFRPACVPALAAVVQEHVMRIEARLSRLVQESDQKAHHITEIQEQYQQDSSHLQATAQGVSTQLALGQQGVTTRWVIKTLFGIGTPQSLILTQQVTQQLAATQQYQAQIAQQQRFFQYCEQIWPLCEHSLVAAHIQQLRKRIQHWQRLLSVLALSPTPDRETILQGLVVPSA